MHSVYEYTENVSHKTHLTFQERGEMKETRADPKYPLLRIHCPTHSTYDFLRPDKCSELIYYLRDPSFPFHSHVLPNASCICPPDCNDRNNVKSGR